MTKKQKSILLICAAIFIGSYIARSLILRAMGVAYARNYNKQLREKPKPETKAADVKAEPMVANLSGVWLGAGPLKSRGTCDLRLELKRGDSDAYTGYSRFSCINTQALLTPKDTNVMTMMGRLNPDAALLTGAVEKGSIRLHTDKAIGTDINGCTVTGFTITPFGTGGAMAEWQEGTCEGGSLLLRKGQ